MEPSWKGGRVFDLNGFEVLLLALLLDAAIGDPAWIWKRIPHPVVIVGHLVSYLESTLNTGQRRRLRGIGGMVLIGTLAILVGEGIHRLPDHGFVEVLVVAVFLAHRNLVDEVKGVATALRTSVAAGRIQVARIVGRDPEVLTTEGIARAAIESAAENLSDGVIAPVFWYAVAGLPGLVFYKAVNTADSMIGYRTDSLADFGWAAARLDDVMNWIPARLTGGLIALVHGSRKAVSCMLRDAPLHRSPNAGWPETAMAAVIGVSLSGPRHYGGDLLDSPYVYDSGRKNAGPEDIEASVHVLWRCWVAFTLAIGGGVLIHRMCMFGGCVN